MQRGIDPGMRTSLPVLLDISRTVSRAGRGVPTGIDRVERAYIRWAQGRPESAYLARLGRKAALISSDSIQQILDDLLKVDERRTWPLGAIVPGKGFRDRRAERIVSKHAQSVAAIDGLKPALRRAFGANYAYVNVGHTHLEDRRLEALKVAGARRVLVLIHDVIPIAEAWSQTPKSAAAFRNRLSAASKHATHILAPSEATKTTIQAHVQGTSAVLLANLLGVDPPQDVPAYHQERPYFVQLGTIEPRKNTKFLLKVWRDLPEPRPELHLLGAKGWLSDSIFAEIRALGRDVCHFEGLPDQETVARLKGAAALLFPSQAEGFGYPLMEALQLGTPVIASDLSVFREIAPVGHLSLSTENATTWSKEILNRAIRGDNGQTAALPLKVPVPRWDRHFETVEALLV